MTVHKAKALEVFNEIGIGKQFEFVPDIMRIMADEGLLEIIRVDHRFCYIRKTAAGKLYHRDLRWDVELWDEKTVRQWMYVIAERSDRLASEASYTEDWSEYESDERMYTKLHEELKRRKLNLGG